MREPRAGPLLEIDETIAISLNGVPYKWWREHRNEPPLSHTSEPVRAVIDGLRMAGYEIIVAGRKGE